MSFTRLFPPLVLLLGFMLPVHAQPMVLNSGFETPNIPTGTFEMNPSGGSWTFTSLTGISDHASDLGTPNPPDNGQVAFISSTSTLFQTISGFQSGPYQVRFFAASSTLLSGASLGVSVDTLQLTFGGSSLFTPPTGTFALFTSDPFTVTPGTHDLNFSGANGQLAFIDSVTLIAVPEPASIMLTLGVACAGAIGLWYRHRKLAMLDETAVVSNVW